MLRGFLFLLIIGALALLVLSWLRRAPRRPSAVEPKPALALPTATAPTKSMSRAEVFRKLHELAFGAELAASVPAEHAKAAPAIAAALQSAATEPRYAPRRPMLLPQLLRAVGDGDTSRRELADIIARDPALVGSLLKLANSPFYRATEQPVESIERAVAVMGMDGVRTLAAAALVQPVFRAAASGKFPEVVWEHSYRAGAAAELHAAAVEKSDPFAAQLLAMVTGLAQIVVFRVGTDQFSSRGLRPDATALAALLDAHSADVALRIAASWELSERILEALADVLPGKPVTPASALGRSLRFGLVAGALMVLATNGTIDDETGVASLAAAGGTGPKFKALWTRFTRS
jgi:HD-like signal output (HDOD) protein